MRGGLVVFGIIILVLAYIVGSMLTAQQQSQLQLAGGVCNSALGTIGSALSGRVAQDCQNVSTINTLLALVPVGYLLGGIMFLVGLAVPGKHKEKNISQTVTSSSEEDESLKTLKMRYAKGEMTKKEYQEMKNDLKET